MAVAYRSPRMGAIVLPEDCEAEGMPPEAWVVNEEAMLPLLKDLGFTQEDGPIWRL